MPNSYSTRGEPAVDQLTNTTVTNPVNDDVLTFDNGLWVNKAGAFDKIEDADGDTRVEVEQAADEDIIRFTTTNIERLQIGNGATGVAAFSNCNVAIGTATVNEGSNLEIQADDAKLRLYSNSGGVTACLEFVRGANTFGSDNLTDYRLIDTAGLFKLQVGYDGATYDVMSINGTASAVNTWSNITHSGFQLTQTNTSAAGCATTAQVLNHYEEGTWTPAWATNGTPPTTLTYNAGSTEGYFTRIGRLVNCSFKIRVTLYTAGPHAGTLKIAGLPFTAKNVSSSGSGGGGIITYADGFNAGFDSPRAIYVIDNDVECNVSSFNAAGADTADLKPSANNALSIAAGCIAMGQFSYII